MVPKEHESYNFWGTIAEGNKKIGELSRIFKSREYDE